MDFSAFDDLPEWVMLAVLYALLVAAIMGTITTFVIPVADTRAVIVSLVGSAILTAATWWIGGRIEKNQAQKHTHR